MMFAKSFASLALLTSLCVPYAAAGIVSLYVPEDVAGSGVPITADPIGTDQSGHTTWRIGVGASSGTFTNLQFAPTSVVATLVEGSTNVEVFANIGGATSAHEACAFATPAASGGVPIASCVLEIADGSTTGTISGTETATPIAVQIADNASGSSAASTRTASGSGTAAPTQTASGSGTAAPTQTGKSNGAGKTNVMGLGALGVLGVTNVMLSVVL